MSGHKTKSWVCGQAADGSWLIQGDAGSFQAPWVYQEGTVAALPPKPESEAYARLIAAAPDLLAACEMVAQMAVGWEALTPGDIAEVRAAIAKATS